jgi:hypothetical protein
MSPESFEDLDAPAYTRALTPLSEFRRSRALEAAARDDAGNRTFNRRFWAALAAGFMERTPSASSIPENPEFLRHRW